jgi:hypothetical protein
LKSISVNKAIIVGTVWVNGPVLPLIVGPALMVFISGAPYKGEPSKAVLWGTLFAFILGFLAAWSWWSYMVPRWRVWAWTHVKNVRELRIRAVQAGVIWPKGHFFEKTEFRSKELQEAITNLEAMERNA